MPTIVKGLALGGLFLSGDFGEVWVIDLLRAGDVLEDFFTSAGSFFTGEFVCVLLARVGKDGVVIDFFSLMPGSLPFFLLSLPIKHSPAFYLAAKR